MRSIIYREVMRKRAISYLAPLGKSSQADATALVVGIVSSRVFVMTITSAGDYTHRFSSGRALERRKIWVLSYAIGTAKGGGA